MRDPRAVGFVPFAAGWGAVTTAVRRGQWESRTGRVSPRLSQPGAARFFEHACEYAHEKTEEGGTMKQDSFVTPTTEIEIGMLDVPVNLLPGAVLKLLGERRNKTTGKREYKVLTSRMNSSDQSRSIWVPAKFFKLARVAA
jgi:hypothetical protein